MSAGADNKRVKGSSAEKLGLIHYYGTTASVADAPKVRRISSVFKRREILIMLEGEGVYIEGGVEGVSEGLNYPIGEAEVVATNSASLQKVVSLTSTLVVGIFLVATKLYAIAGTVAVTGVITWASTASTVNDAATTGADICRLNDTQYGISYIDDGGDDYLAVRGGSVSGTVITQGDEKLLNAAALKTTAGTGITLANTLTVCVAYVLDSDGKGLLIASTFDGDLTFSAGGTAVEFDGGNDTKELNICSHDTGDVSVVYQAGGDANDPITMCCATVSAAKAIVAGAEVSMAGAASAATGIDCAKLYEDCVVFTWVDSTFVHVNTATIVGTTPTKKTELALTSTAGLTPQISTLSNTKVSIAYEDDANANDVGQVVLVKIVANVCTKLGVYQFTQAAVVTPGICTLSPERVLLFFEDDANNDRNTSLIGDIDAFLIDVRSQVGSAKYNLWMTPIGGRKRSG